MGERALIVDSGLRNRGGHNFSYTRAVQQSLERRGIGVDVLASRHLAIDLARGSGFVPAFSLGAYDFPPGNGKLRDLAYLYAQATVFAEELVHHLRQIGAAGHRLAFSHTLGDFELLAWSRVMRRWRPDGTLLLLLRRTPGFRRAGGVRTRLHPYWRLRRSALGAIGRRLGPRFALLTDSEPLTDDHRAIFGGRVVTVPIPVSERTRQPGPHSRLHERYPLAPDGRLRIGYLGDSRPTKGFGLLPGVVRTILDRPELKARFLVQCPPAASGTVADEPAALAELRDLERRADGRLVLVAEHLDEGEYADLLRCLDVVLVPYVRDLYREPTSGIFAEALALGKPVAVTRGTWMAAELERGGAGVEFEDGSVTDLAEQVSRLLTHYDDFCRLALERAPAWAAFHNVESLVDRLLAETRRPR